MAHYEQNGIKKCPKCGAETENKYCPNCHSSTRGNGTWSVRFRMLDETQKKDTYKRLRGFNSKKEAEIAYKSYIELAKQEQQPQFKFEFQKLLKEYLIADKPNTKDSTHYDKLSVFKLYLTPYFADKNIAELTKTDYMNFQETLWASNGTHGKPLSSKYKNKIRGFLNHFLDWCFQKYDIVNRLSAVAKPKCKTPPREIKFWESKNIVLFLKLVDDMEWKSFFTLMFYSGMRVGECKALTDKDLSLKKQQVSITKSLTRKTLDGSLYKITETKNYKNRITPIPTLIIPQMQEYLQWKKDNNISSEFLFGGDKPLCESTIARMWDKLVIISQLERIRIHDIRHSYVSMLVHLNVNTKTIATLIGDTEEQVIKTYSHLYSDATVDAVELMNMFIRQSA
ncbi:MAG: tyrosine-type recombinase/integrase [Clostridia bacterium]